MKTNLSVLAFLVAALLAIACGGDGGGFNNNPPAEAGASGEAGETGSDAGSPSQTTGGSNAGTGGSDGGSGEDPSVGGETAAGGTPSEGGAAPTTGGTDDGGTGNQPGTGGTDAGAPSTTGGSEPGTGGSAPIAGSSGSGGSDPTGGDAGSDAGGSEPGTGGTSTTGGSAPTGGSPTCDPTPKPPASGSMGSMGCSEWTFTEFEGEAFDLSGDAVCLSASDCYFALGTYDDGYSLYHWDGADLTVVTLPDGIDVQALATSGNTILLAGETPDGGVIYRKVGSGSWSELMGGISFQGWSNGSVTSLEKVGNTFYAGVKLSTTDPGPCQGLCGTVYASRVYELDGNTWTLLTEIDQAAIEDFSGSAVDDLLVVGSYVNAQGISIAPLFQRLNGCDSEDYSDDLPNGMVDVGAADQSDGEVISIGYLGDGYTGTRATSDDLESWDSSDLPDRHASFAVAAFGRGAAVAVGVYRPDGGGPEAFLAARSAGNWEAPQYLPSNEATAVLFIGTASVILTRNGIASATCQ